MIKKQKIKAIIAKQRRTRGKISLFIEKKDENNIRDNINPK